MNDVRSILSPQGYALVIGSMKVGLTVSYLPKKLQAAFIRMLYCFSIECLMQQLFLNKKTLHYLDTNLLNSEYGPDSIRMWRSVTAADTFFLF